MRYPGARDPGRSARSGGDAPVGVGEYFDHARCFFARVDGRRLAYKFALDAFKQAQKAAVVEGYRLHDYRRSVARRLEQGGIPRSTAMKITGHRTEHVFRQMR